MNAPMIGQLPVPNWVGASHPRIFSLAAVQDFPLFVPSATQRAWETKQFEITHGTVLSKASALPSTSESNSEPKDSSAQSEHSDDDEDINSHSSLTVDDQAGGCVA
jgi:hypothetical protein